MNTQKNTEEKIQEKIKKLQAEVGSYNAEVAKINDMKTLQDMEQELIKQMNENDEYLKTVKYKLSEGTVFDGKEYKKSVVAGMILTQLNKMEANWQMTLGYYNMYQIWKSVPDEVEFTTLDATLRTLQQLKFKGMDDWKSILIINEYFKFNHEAYTDDLVRAQVLSEKHNTIMDRMQLVAKESNIVDPDTVPQNDLQMN